MTWKTITLLAFLAYWAVCRFLRYRRFHQIQRRFEGREKESLSIQEAQWVVEQILQLEMCYLVRLSQAFALFRTYGIPTISRVLLKYGLPLICLLSHYAGMTEFRTTEFAKPDSGARRYADTGVLVSDFTTWPFDSERHARAVARVNFLHSHYPIKNDDMLYTLATAATNPQRWLEKYEWRPLTDLEVEALWILWREIGHQLKIKDIPKTYSEVRDWASEYEKRAMVPTEANHQLAEVTIGLFVNYVPGIFKTIIKRIIIGLMDDRLRAAMMYAPQPYWVDAFINWGFRIRGFLLRNFALPRTKRIIHTSEERNRFGRYTVNFADNTPWYLPPDKVGVVEKWMNALMGIPNPSPRYKMEGYVIEELGPIKYEGKGIEKMDREVADLMARGKSLTAYKSSVGCPWASVK